MILIKKSKKNWYVFCTDSDLEISASLSKFSLRKRLALVIIHDVKDSLKTDDTSGSTSLDLVSEQSHEFLTFLLAWLRNRFVCNILLSARIDWSVLFLTFLIVSGVKDCRELLVVNQSITTAIIVIEHHFKIRLVHDNTDLFNRAEELIEVYWALVLNIKELEAASQECGLVLSGRALILDLSF